MWDIHDFNMEMKHRQLGDKYIPIKYEEGDNWHFVVIDRGKGVKGLSVF